MNSKEASKPESEPEWYINTFIRHNLPFLYQQGIMESDKPTPKVSVVKNALEKYIRDEGIFEIPKHESNNRINLNKMYKKLHNFIHKGKPHKS